MENQNHQQTQRLWKKGSHIIKLILIQIVYKF